MNLRHFWSNPWHPEIGFSGTMHGMTHYQHVMVRLIVRVLTPSYFHHGQGLGADVQAHALVSRRHPGTVIHSHPSTIRDMMATASGGHIVHTPKPPQERNHDIVNASDIMLFTPKEDHPVLRSGTWSTFRYSLSLNKPMVLIKPNGSSIFYDGGKEVMQTNVASLTNPSGGANFTASGNGTSLAIDHTDGGYFCFYASGDFSGGTAKLQVSLDGTTWLDVTGASLSANGYKVCQVFGRFARGVLTGATTPTLAMKLAGINTGLVRTNS